MRVLQKILSPTLELENAAYSRGFRKIAGIDEAGRGPLAGPVVVAAVILGRNWNTTFELNDSIDSDKFVKTLKIIQPTMSLAGVESTITSPAKTSHRKMDPKDRDKIGITKNLLRFSVGIEDVDDLINDISNALEING